MRTNRMRTIVIGVVGGVAAAMIGCTAGGGRATTDKRATDVLEEMYRSEREGMLNAPPEDCRLIRILVETAKAKRVVEIGTSNGYSGIWICQALRATGGKLTTYEIDPKRAALAKKNFARAGVEGLVTLVEGDAHKEVVKLKEPIDVLFIDADKSGYVDYLKKLLPLVRPGGLILAHNTRNCAKDLQEYIQMVTTSPDLETVLLNSNEQGMGITLKK